MVKKLIYYTNKSIVLTTSPLSEHFKILPDDNKIMSLRDCLVHDNHYVQIDHSMIKPVIRTNTITENSFSTGYRSASINGIEYKFTKSQAAIIELLHNADKPVHKHELMVAAGSEQDNPKYIFRVKGEYHPAWNKIIKFDSQGYYWLEI